MWPEEGDFPENVHRVVYVIINKRSFESFQVFGSDFITLAVILVSAFFSFLIQHVCWNWAKAFAPGIFSHSVRRAVMLC